MVMAVSGWRLEASSIDSALDAFLDSALGLRVAGMAVACGACVLGTDATASSPSTRVR